MRPELSLTGRAGAQLHSCIVVSHTAHLSPGPDAVKIRSMSFLKTIRRPPNWAVMLIALVLIALIGWLDHMTDPEWSFFAPYAVPIVLATWNIDRRAGSAVAVLCAAAYWMAEREYNIFHTGWGFALSVFGRLFYFLVLVVAVTALKAKRELDRSRIETLERARALEAQILRITEREQERIGRDLHDSLGSHLAALGYAATFLATDLRRRNLPEAANAEQVRDMAGGAASLARELAHGIFPVQMHGAGLSTALAELARTFSTLTGMSVVYCETGDPQIADPEDRIHLYRIAQEALNNAAKHGGASKVTIALNRSVQALRLTVADDGKGMPPSPGGGHSLGLDSMRYRAHVLRGELKIDSLPGEGTIVSCEIPGRQPQPATTAT